MTFKNRHILSLTIEIFSSGKEDGVVWEGI
jgi:hypothetical protein